MSKRSDRSRGLTPFLVVVNVGTTNPGAIDPIEDVCNVSQAEGLWVHADACYGGLFRLLPGMRDVTRGLPCCDSAAAALHKGFFLPYGTGVLVVKDGEMLRRTHTSGCVCCASGRMRTACVGRWKRFGAKQADEAVDSSPASGFPQDPAEPIRSTPSPRAQHAALFPC